MHGRERPPKVGAGLSPGFLRNSSHVPGRVSKKLLGTLGGTGKTDPPPGGRNGGRKHSKEEALLRRSAFPGVAMGKVGATLKSLPGSRTGSRGNSPEPHRAVAPGGGGGGGMALPVGVGLPLGVSLPLGVTGVGGNLDQSNFSLAGAARAAETGRFDSLTGQHNRAMGLEGPRAEPRKRGRDGRMLPRTKGDRLARSSEEEASPVAEKDGRGRKRRRQG